MPQVARQIPLAIAVLCLPIAALAADNDDSASFDEVVVTATRRETRLLDTPISMTVIGAETLPGDSNLVQSITAARPRTLSLTFAERF